MSVAEDSATLARTRSRRLWWLSLLLLGPVTGLLVNLCVGNLNARRPMLAAACVVALVAFWIGAPALLAAELHHLHTQLAARG